jgi:hypothetical protein
MKSMSNVERLSPGDERSTFYVAEDRFHTILRRHTNF